MSLFVAICGFYNASAVLVFLAPGAMELVGLKQPYTPFWVWLPSLLGLFAGIVVVFSARDLKLYGSFPYWNGIIRVIFVIASFSMDFRSSAGTFIGLLALGDLPLGLGCIFALPYVLKRSHLSLPTKNRLLRNNP